MSQSDSNWPGWILAALAGIGGLYTGLQRLFVTHSQLQKTLEAERHEAEKRHERTIDELRHSVTATFANGIEVLRKDVDRRHLENREDMKEMRKLIQEHRG